MRKKYYFLLSRMALCYTLLFLLLVAPAALAADVKLAWDPNNTTDLAGYGIYFRESIDGPPYDLYGYVTLAELQDINLPTFTVTDLKNGFRYFFAVTAFDTEGNESYYSNSVCTECGDNNSPCKMALSVVKIGTGTGRVTGGHIDCGDTCSDQVDFDTNITLKAFPDAGSVFVGWGSGGCFGQDSCTLTMKDDTTVTPEFAGKPKPVIAIVNKGWESPGTMYIELKITNSGTGDAINLKINALNLKTLMGSGSPTYNSTLSPALPLPVGNLKPGASATLKIYLNVPSTVKRFSITESGTVQDVIGTSSAFQVGQAIFP